MRWSLWYQSGNSKRIGVSLSPSNRLPIGHIVKAKDGTWSIEGDRANRSFEYAQDAIKTLVAEAEPLEAQSDTKAKSASGNE